MNGEGGLHWRGSYREIATGSSCAIHTPTSKGRPALRYESADAFSLVPKAGHSIQGSPFADTLQSLGIGPRLFFDSALSIAIAQLAVERMSPLDLAFRFPNPSWRPCVVSMIPAAHILMHQGAALVLRGPFAQGGRGIKRHSKLPRFFTEPSHLVCQSHPSAPAPRAIFPKKRVDKCA